jgi:DNA polymerase-3 subunit alpha
LTDFTNLHVHSYYSLMDGLNSPEELLSVTKDLGQNSLAITDHGTLSGHRELQRAAVKLGMKPILGLEAYVSPTDRFDRRPVKTRDDNTSLYNHMIILAQDQKGLENLQALSAAAWNEGYYFKPRMDRELLEKHSEGLIVTTACMSGLVQKAIERGDEEQALMWMSWYKDTFGDNFYVEVQPHNSAELNHKLLELADLYSVKPIVTTDCHYAEEKDRAVEEMMLILSTSPKIDRTADFEKSRQMSDIFERLNYLYPDRPISFAEIDVFLQGRVELQPKMEAQGIFRTDIYENTNEIADKVGSYEYHENLSLLPEPRVNPNDRLHKMVFDGLKARGLDADQVYVSRAEEELRVITSKNFSAYFLIVADKISYARSQGILVGPGRGSAAGSLVCYALGITMVDPIKYDLLFGRFINEERNDFPDIDVDFEDSRRKEVKDHLARKFKHVASIATFSFFKDKGVVRDAARVYSIPVSEVNKALKTVETFEDFETAEATEEFRRKYPEVLTLARALRGRIRSTGLHAAGIVVANGPISKYAPMETRKDPKGVDKERIPVVAYDMNDVADIGLIKIDALGLKTLSVISDALRKIEARTGKKIDLESLDLEDAAVYRDMANGFTKGMFQAEAVTYTDLAMKLELSSFNELVVSNALVRPGAMNTVGAEYISRKNGLSQVNYVHPDVEAFTRETYGLIIYQEQVMRACVELAGMTWAEADRIRKIIGKKKDVKEFDQYREHFVEGARKKISKRAAEKLWKDFEAHAGYSFNKSHAVAYSLLTYWTAWLKHYYPLEFMSSALANEGDKDVLTDYLIESKRMGIPVKLPHVNTSASNFEIQGDGIQFGLSSIKYISDTSAQAIMRMRPFQSFAHLQEKAFEKGSGINSRAVDAMNAVGAAEFSDNPLKGTERSNFYEYLGIPNFSMSEIPERIMSRVTRAEDFEEKGVFVMIGLVKKIKRGAGWARVEFLDETGSVGVFHGEKTQIDPGTMYLFLIGDNRIHRYIPVDEISTSMADPFISLLMAEEFSLPENQYYVVDFTHYKTKAGKMMAHTIIANKDRDMRRVLVFNKNYPSALAKMRPGGPVGLSLARTDDQTLFVAGVK